MGKSIKADSGGVDFDFADEDSDDENYLTRRLYKKTLKKKRKTYRKGKAIKVTFDY